MGDSELFYVLDEQSSGRETVLPFMLMAKELDDYSREVVDLKMCSEDCPCYDEGAHNDEQWED